MQNTQLPTKSPIELMDNSNLHKLKTLNVQIEKIKYVIDARWTNMKWSM